MRRDTPQYITQTARQLRKEQTCAENIVWHYLRNGKLDGYKFRRQYGIGRCIVDFYLSKARLAIEIDGNIHENSEQKEYDILRQKEIEMRGIKLIRFNNEEVMNNIGNVLLKIKEEVNNILK